MENKFRHWLEVFRSHASLGYQLLFLLTIVLGFFFAVPSFLYGNETLNQDTEIGVQNRITIGKVSFFLLERKYNPKTGYVEMMLKLDGNLPSDTQLKILAGEVRNEVEVSSRIQILTENYAFIQLEHIPEKWQSIVIDIGTIQSTKNRNRVVSLQDLFDSFGVEQEEKQDRITQNKLYISAKKIPQDGTIQPQEMSFYVDKALVLEIKELEKLIVENDVQRTTTRQEIQTIEGEISELEERKKYQTESEVRATDSEISQKNNLIKQQQSIFEKAKASNDELKEKIEKLHLQRQDIQASNE